MADELSVTIAFVLDHYEVVASLTETEALPEAIFLYENNGTVELGAYYGVASIDELTSRAVWSGVAIPTFGNKFVRHVEGLVIAPTLEEAEKSKQWIISRVKQLKNQVLAQESNTQVIVV